MINESRKDRIAAAAFLLTLLALAISIGIAEGAGARGVDRPWPGLTVSVRQGCDGARPITDARVIVTTERYQIIGYTGVDGELRLPFIPGDTWVNVEPRDGYLACPDGGRPATHLDHGLGRIVVTFYRVR